MAIPPPFLVIKIYPCEKREKGSFCYLSNAVNLSIFRTSQEKGMWAKGR